MLVNGKDVEGIQKRALPNSSSHHQFNATKRPVALRPRFALACDLFESETSKTVYHAPATKSAFSPRLVQPKPRFLEFQAKCEPQNVNGLSKMYRQDFGVLLEGLVVHPEHKSKKSKVGCQPPFKGGGARSPTPACRVLEILRRPLRKSGVGVKRLAQSAGVTIWPSHL